MKHLFLVFLGGGLGSMIRYSFYLWINVNQFKWLPTLGANVLGCLLLGLVAGYHIKNPLEQGTYLLLATGFCGGFTTLSTFSFEVLDLIRNNELTHAAIYLGLSIVLGIAFAYLGVVCSRFLG